MPPVAVADPSAGEWVAAALAAGMVAAVVALHLLRPVLGRSAATTMGRVGGFLLATLAGGLVLVVAVLDVAGWRASDGPVGPFVGVLVHPEEPTAGRLASYATALLLPLAAVLAVLAVAVVDAARSAGLRAAGLAAAAFVMLAGATVAIADAGTAARGAGWAALVVAAGAAGALALDALDARRNNRQSVPTY